MSYIILQLPAGSDASASGLGTMSSVPYARDVYAGYLFGSRFTDSPMEDISPNARNLTAGSGSATFGTDGIAATPSNYLLTPFSPAQFLSLGNGTIVAVHATPNANAASLAVGLRISPSVNGIGLVTRDGASNQRLRGFDNGGSTAVDLTSTTARDSAYEMAALAAGTAGKLVYRRKAGMLAAETASLGTAIGTAQGSSPFAIGTMPGGGGYTATTNIAAVLFFPFALTAAQLDDVFVNLQEYFGRFPDSAVLN